MSAPVYNVSVDGNSNDSNVILGSTNGSIVEDDNHDHVNLANKLAVLENALNLNSTSDLAQDALVATNASGVATNASGVATNASGVATNLTRLDVHEGLVLKNIDDISANKDTLAVHDEYFNKMNNILPEIKDLVGTGVGEKMLPNTFVNYNKMLSLEAQHNKQQLELTASKVQLDILENKLKDFKAVDFNLPPSKGNSSLVIPETKKGFSPLRNDNHHTVNGLVSVFNTGIIPDTWTITPEMEENDSGAMINKNNTFNAIGETLDKYSLNHLMSGVELNDYKLSFNVSIKDLEKSSAFLMFDITGEGSSYVYKYYDFDSHYNNLVTNLKSDSDNLNLSAGLSNGSEYFQINKLYNVTIYKQGSEIAILFDASGSTTRKVFSVNEVSNFGFLSNPNIEISSIKLNAVLAVLDDGYDTPDRFGNPSGFAYNILSSTDGNKILYQHKMSLFAGPETHVFEIVEFKPGYIESLFRSHMNGNTFLYTTDDSRFIATEIDYNNEKKHVIFDTESERPDKLLMDPVTFDNNIKEKLNVVINDISMQLQTIGLYSLTTTNNNKELYLKVIIEKILQEDPNKLFGELPEINKELIYTGTIKIYKHENGDWVIDDPVLYNIRTPNNILVINNGNAPNCSPREPSNLLNYNDKEKLLHFNVTTGYELINMDNVKRKQTLSLVFYKGLLVSKTVIKPYTYDTNSTRNVKGDNYLLLDRTRYQNYINCACVNLSNVMFLTGVYIFSDKNIQDDLRNSWGIFSNIDTSSLMGLYDNVSSDLTINEWDVISNDIYSVVDDRYGLVEFGANDVTKIPNLDTYGYGQTINDQENVLVVPCRWSGYKSLAIYKINLPLPPNYAVGFFGAPGNLELKCIVESNKQGRYHAGMFNRVTVSKNFIGATNWYTGTTDFISINSVLNTKDPIIKSLPKNTSEFVNGYRGVRNPTFEPVL